MNPPTNNETRAAARRLLRDSHNMYLPANAKVTRAPDNPKHGAYVTVKLWVYDLAVDPKYVGAERRKKETTPDYRAPQRYRGP